MPIMLRIMRRASVRWHYLSLLVLAAILAACAGARTNSGDGTDVYRSGDDYVRLEPIEPGAPANSHPFAISAAQLRELLAPLKVSRADSIDRVPVFLNEELDTIVPPLVSALSKAGPNQDVTFAVTGQRGLFGRRSPRSLTTGRLFVSGDSINLIFGLMQLRLESEKVDPALVIAPMIIPGTRSRRIDTTGWKLDPVGGYFHDQRADWVMFDRSALKPETTPATAPAPGTDAKPGGGTSAPTTDSKVQEIEKRLQVLDALRKKGAITEQEYLERRRAILEQL